MEQASVPITFSSVLAAINWAHTQTCTLQVQLEDVTRKEIPHEAREQLHKLRTNFPLIVNHFRLKGDALDPKQLSLLSDKVHALGGQVATLRTRLTGVTGLSENGPLKYDVFVSHAGPDKFPIAHPLHKALEDVGYRSFFDNDELNCSHRTAPSMMVTAMQQAKVGLFVLSPEFAIRRWPMRELRSFLARNKDEEGEEKPALFPVFFRMSVGETAGFFDEYENVLRAVLKDNSPFFKDENQQECSMKDANAALKAITKFPGVEASRAGDAKKLSTEAMVQETVRKVQTYLEDRRRADFAMIVNYFSEASKLGSELLGALRIYADHYVGIENRACRGLYLGTSHDFPAESDGLHRFAHLSKGDLSMSYEWHMWHIEERDDNMLTLQTGREQNKDWFLCAHADKKTIDGNVDETSALVSNIDGESELNQMFWIRHDLRDGWFTLESKYFDKHLLHATNTSHGVIRCTLTAADGLRGHGYKSQWRIVKMRVKNPRDDVEYRY